MNIVTLAINLGIAAGIIALLYVAYLMYVIFRTSYPRDRAAEIHEYIREAALAFMRSQYTVVTTVFMAITLLLLISGAINRNSLMLNTGLAYFLGALSSAAVSIIGMYTAILTNVRVLSVLKEHNLKRALRIAFRGGSVTGFLVGGVGVLGISLLLKLFGAESASSIEELRAAVTPVLGYAFGASTVALFARVGGGIYTKAADVGSDLVGKVEVGIPEDDPRNPGVIADNVGDNVGDCAGMGADLFESYVESIVAAMSIATFIATEAFNLVAYPLVFATVALLTSIAAVQFVEFSPLREPSRTLTLTSIVGLTLVAVVTYIVGILLGFHHLQGLWVAALSGLIAGGIIGFTSDYFTSPSYKPVKIVAAFSRAGPALTILSGFSMGFYSTFIPTLSIALATLTAYYVGHTTIAGLGLAGVLGGIYSVALAGVGMLAVTSIVVSADAYGPIVDNAAGLAEQAGYPEEVRELADKLDSAGNTMKSISKGYAIGSAALTALALLFTYVSNLKPYLGEVEITTLFSLSRPDVLAGLVIGAAVPALFTAVVVDAVTAAAFVLVEEIRRQFRERPGILEWKEKPDYARAVNIVTRYAIKRLLVPGIIALATPILVGSFLGLRALGGALLGATASGLLLGLFQGNVGNTWDNAKKHIEAGAFGGKGSEAHKAAVIGDTVGDPLKDAAGPSINILIKLMAISSTVFIPFIIAIRTALGLPLL
ncbi:MAG: sodium-translocating pyrophosphatase [Thermoprotei archaeon]|nr:MAG: sodium-translocating pyrophosphatase [Thermoprotei archaeon]